MILVKIQKSFFISLYKMDELFVEVDGCQKVLCLPVHLYIYAFVFYYLVHTEQI